MEKLNMSDVLWVLAFVVIIFCGILIHVYLVDMKNKRNKEKLMKEYYDKRQRGMS
jgi:hypothetical protein